MKTSRYSSSPWTPQTCEHCGSFDYSLQWIGSVLLCPDCAANVLVVQVGFQCTVVYWKDEYRLIRNAVDEAKVLMTADGFTEPAPFMMDERFDWESAVTKRAAAILKLQGIVQKTNGDFEYRKIASAIHGVVV